MTLLIASTLSCAAGTLFLRAVLIWAVETAAS